MSDFGFGRLLQKSIWQDMQMSDDARASIEQGNMPPAKERYAYDHLVGGFKGARFGWCEGTRVLSQKEVGQLWAALRIAVKAARDATGR